MHKKYEPSKMCRSLLAVIFFVGACFYAAFQLSPWPSVLLMRHGFGSDADDITASTAPFVLQNISAQEGLNYIAGEQDALLDLFAPADAGAPLPAVIWLHGGGFVAGSRSAVSGYLKILASRGFAAVAIDYTLAPTARFPSPVRQTNAALAYVIANATRFNIDPKRILLAGDSAGAQIAAQTALVISDPDYARRIGVAPGMPRSFLRGLVLFCGLYDLESLNFAGQIGRFMRTVIWSYVGTRDPHDERVPQMSVTPFVTAAYPPAFISVGNTDPFNSQSVELAAALRAKGIAVDTLFFPDDNDPPVGHEYQFQLGTDAGRLALDRALEFLTARATEP